MPLDNLTESDEDLAAHFLKYWGISALFHDIGYPFELSFEQVKSYFKNNINYVPFVMYNMNNYLVSEATYHIPKMEKELEEAKKRLSENDSGINEKDINNYKRIVESYPDKMNTLKRQQQEAEAKLKKCFLPDIMKTSATICIFILRMLLNSVLAHGMKIQKCIRLILGKSRKEIQRLS